MKGEIYVAYEASHRKFNEKEPPSKRGINKFSEIECFLLLKKHVDF